MEERTQCLRDDLGLHARSAANFVRVASKFQSDIQLEYGNKRISAKSLLGILSLNLNFNKEGEKREIKVIATGPDEKQAVSELCALIENCFIPLEEKDNFIQSDKNTSSSISNSGSVVK